MNSRLIVLGLVVMLGFALRAAAAGLPIEILDTKNSTEVLITRWISPRPPYALTNFSRAQVSAGPVTDSLYNPRTGMLTAEASAGPFGVHVFTPVNADQDGYFVRGRASATNEVWFSALTSQTSTLTIQFAADGHWWDCTAGGLSLINVTSGDEVFNYQWYGDTGTVAGTSVVELNNTFDWSQVLATFQLNAVFDTTDTYKLTVFTRAFSDNSPRSPTVSLQVFGFDQISVVPEPSVLSLLGFGTLAWVVRRKIWRKSQYE